MHDEWVDLISHELYVHHRYAPTSNKAAAAAAVKSVMRCAGFSLCYVRDVDSLCYVQSLVLCYVRDLV